MGQTYWNHNVHYHPVVLDAVPSGCRAALDVGCGEGLLARGLAARAERVVGVDVSAVMIAQAREHSAGIDRVSFLEADIVAVDDLGQLRDGAYDFVCSVAAVHHMDFAAAMARMVRLLAPGGRLVIVGLARNRTPGDWLISGAGVPVARFLARRNSGKTGPVDMPTRDPEMSWGEVRRAARAALPGCRFRRHLLWRYSVVWDKPGRAESGGDERMRHEPGSAEPGWAEPERGRAGEGEAGSASGQAVASASVGGSRAARAAGYQPATAPTTAAAATAPARAGTGTVHGQPREAAYA